MSKKYIGNGNSKYNISYHIVWIPKYRKHLLSGLVESKLKLLISEKLVSLGLPRPIIECMPDHVHLFIKSNTTYTISYIVKILKGYTSFKLRSEFVHLTKLKALWAPGFFCETIGNITEETVIRYIENQKIYKDNDI